MRNRTLVYLFSHFVNQAIIFHSKCIGEVCLEVSFEHHAMFIQEFACIIDILK